MDRFPTLESLPPGLVGAMTNLTPSAVNALGGGSSLALGPLLGLPPGALGAAGAVWMGAQDFCRLLEMLVDRDGAGGSGPGSSVNSMFPPSLNCHFFPPGPALDPEKQCGDCPPKPLEDGPLRQV